MFVHTKKTLTLVILLGGILSLSTQVFAAEDLETIKAEINTIRSDPERLQKAIEMGSEKSDFCQLCHGQDGNAIKPNVPNLAQQNPAYLVDQFNNFATGKREDFTGVMKSLVDSLSREERIALALYFSSTSLKPLPYDEAKAMAGKARFQRVCKLCHGEDGQGKEGYARIGGQKQDYILDTLKIFRDQKAGKFRNRKSSLMTAYVTGLSDQELEQLAHYITSLGTGNEQ